MNKIKFKGIVVKIYFDGKSYFNVCLILDELPENVDWKSFEIVNDKGEIGHSTGYCDLDKKTIWLCVTKGCEFSDLLSTVSHEMGHLIEGGFKKNPPTGNRYFNLHEKKAGHYENFVLDCYELTNKIMNKIK